MEKLIIRELRGDIVEARHNVSVVVYHNDQIEMNIGDTDVVVPMRSTAKPLMLCPLLRACSQHGIRLVDSDISIMASSHNGEAVHRQAVLSLLELSDSTVTDLACGTHLPYFEWLYEEYFAERDLLKRQLYHNCSAKHAGMLLLASLSGVEKNNYWEMNHPVQQNIITSVKSIMRIKGGDVFYVSKDGCGVPTYCVSLRRMGKAYQALYQDERLFAVAKAILSKPYYIAGKDRIETDIITQCGFIAKSGSSGLFAIACPEENISIVLKVEDGNDDAAESAAVEILDKLGLINENQRLIFEKYRTLPIYTSTLLPVGNYSPFWSNS